MTKTLTAILAITTLTLTLGTSCNKEDKDTSNSPEEIFKTDPSFETLLTSIDKAIGKRMQIMKMEGMETATYDYNGPLDEVTKLVTAYAEINGYTKEDFDMKTDMSDLGEEMPEALKALQSNMSYQKTKMFRHKDGKMLTMVSMKMKPFTPDGEEMTMLTIQKMDYKAMDLPNAEIPKLPE